MINCNLLVFQTQFVASEGQKHAKKSQIEKNPWSVAERTAVLQFFQDTIRKGIVPGKAPCAKCLLENPVLERRKWTVIKDFVRNTITKAKRYEKD